MGGLTAVLLRNYGIHCCCGMQCQPPHAMIVTACKGFGSGDSRYKLSVPTVRPRPKCKLLFSVYRFVCGMPSILPIGIDSQVHQTNANLLTTKLHPPIFNECVTGMPQSKLLSVLECLQIPVPTGIAVKYSASHLPHSFGSALSAIIGGTTHVKLSQGNKKGPYKCVRGCV